MSIKEAIKKLSALSYALGISDKTDDDITNDYINAINVGIDALTKQVEASPKFFSINNRGDTTVYYTCPRCNSVLGIDDIVDPYPFCDNCGQAIDWDDIIEEYEEDEEEENEEDISIK